jgi:hypothetical protein
MARVDDVIDSGDAVRPSVGDPVTADRTAARPVLVEVIGPAAAGKTSLVRALRRSDPSLAVGLRVPRWRWFPALMRRLTPIFALWVLRYRRDRWFTWNEMKSIAFVDAWLSTVERDGAVRGPTLLDHGPVYRLARIREFGPAVARSDRFERWRAQRLRRWLGVLDLIVSLDAPDDALLARVDERGHWWLSEHRPIEDKRDFYARYRRAFEEALRTPVPDPPSVVRVRSDEATPEEIAERVLSRPEIGRPGGTQEGRR